MLQDLMKIQVLKFAVGHAMFCPKCGKCLDWKSSTTAEWSTSEGKMSITACNPCYDALKASIKAKVEAEGLTLVCDDEYDGAVLSHPALPLEDLCLTF